MTKILTSVESYILKFHKKINIWAGIDTLTGRVYLELLVNVIDPLITEKLNINVMMREISF